MNKLLLLLVLTAAPVLADDFRGVPDVCRLWLPRACGPLVEEAKVITRVKPAYPIAAQRLKRSGVARVVVVIDERGRVVSATANETGLFTKAAIDAAWKWRFAPARVNHRSVRAEGVLTFNFED